MKPSLKFVCLLVVLLSVSSVQGASRRRGLGSLFSSLMGGSSKSDQAAPEVYEPEWTDFKTIQLNTGEKHFSQRDLFDKVEVCVQECVKKHGNSRTFRDKCVQEVCEIY